MTPERGAGHSISFPARLDEIGREKGVEPAAIEVWFADEARIGQKNKITRRWAKRGTRPSAPTDQRTASAYIFGPFCPNHGKGAALILPRCNTEAMNLHLAEKRRSDRAGRTRGASRRSGRLASVGPARHAAQRHLDPVVGEMSAAQSAGKRLAVPARQLFLKPDPQTLRRRRPPLLRGLEQARRSTLADHVHRPSQLGPWVLINESWYKRFPEDPRPPASSSQR